MRISPQLVNQRLQVLLENVVAGAITATPITITTEWSQQTDSVVCHRCSTSNESSHVRARIAAGVPI
jgi:hypothetical protein